MSCLEYDIWDRAGSHGDKYIPLKAIIRIHRKRMWRNLMMSAWLKLNRVGRFFAFPFFFFDATDRGISMLPVAVVTTEGFVDLFFFCWTIKLTPQKVLTLSALRVDGKMPRAYERRK